MRVLAWNVQFVAPSGRKGTAASRAIDSFRPDVMCLTEARVASLPATEQTVWADADYGYPAPPDRRKVGLWSRWGWHDVDTLGSAAMPQGRFIAGTTPSPEGPVRVIGVCIPWRMAHVATGSRDRAVWQDHLTYLAGLAEVVHAAGDGPLIVTGDFNQRFHGRMAPGGVHDALRSALEGLSVPTAVRVEGLRRPLIDHIAHSRRLETQGPPIGIDRCQHGIDVSDHDGVVVDLAPARPQAT